MQLFILKQTTGFFVYLFVFISLDREKRRWREREMGGALTDAERKTGERMKQVKGQTFTIA